MGNSDSPWSLLRKNWDSVLPICTCRLLFFKYYIMIYNVPMQSCLIRFDFSCSKKNKNWSRLWLRFVPPLRVPSLSRHSHGRQPPSSLLAWEFVEGRKESTEGSTSEMLSLKIPLPIFPSLSCHANLPRLAAGMDSLRVNQLQVWVINLQSTPKLPDNETEANHEMNRNDQCLLRLSQGFLLHVSCFESFWGSKDPKGPNSF